jgi:hypothetical protein
VSDAPTIQDGERQRQASGQEGEQGYGSWGHAWKFGFDSADLEDPA